MTTTLNLKSVAFAYGQQPILKDISFTIEAGQIACLLGPSGCGKSTLLRLIAGFEQPASGSIQIGKQLVADGTQSISPQNRQVGMLFQDLALFPHLNVSENIAFGLHQHDKHKQQQRVDELLELCRLQAFKTRYPHQLSGGQCQRVALARAMAPKPKLILLDEPFSSVETGLQSELVHEVKTMLQADDSTALWVTHSLDEAFAVADQMGVMLGGKLLQWSTPADLYNNPANADVVRFLNHANLVSGVITGDRKINTQLGLFDLNEGSENTIGNTLQLVINKQNIILNEGGQNNATVDNAVYQGGQYLVTALLGNNDRIQFHHHTPLKSNQAISLTINHTEPLQSFKQK